MKLICDEGKGVITLVPVESGEEGIIAYITRMVGVGKAIDYGGRGPDLHDPSKFVFVYLNIGDKKIVLQGSDESDKGEVNNIRNMCYFGSGSLIYLGETEVDGKKSVDITVRKCKHCGKNMCSLAECEWGVCHECAKKCDHKIKSGPVHGGSAGFLAEGEFCVRCGRAKEAVEKMESAKT